MGAITQIPLAEYLATSYEPDREYVDGELIERAMPDLRHSFAQTTLAALFFALSKQYPVVPLVELRSRLGEKHYRIPDVALYSARPVERYPSFPPLVAVEIVSPDDPMSQIVRKLREYRAFGVPNIWLIDPEIEEFYVFDSNGLYEVAELTLPEFGFEVKPLDLFPPDLAGTD